MEEGVTHLGHDGVHLLHDQGQDAGQEGFEGLPRLLDHHLEDLQELLHHPAACTALLQDAGGQLLPEHRKPGLYFCLSLGYTSP